MNQYLLILLFLPLAFFSESKEEKVINELYKQKEVIIAESQEAGISPRLVASILYAERFLNYSWDDAILDDVLAYSGYNSSVGFGQIKITTAFWIEQELHNSKGLYYLGKSFELNLPRSQSREELIEKTKNDSINIKYCAAYLAMIQHRWRNAGVIFLPNTEVGILGALYSLGVVQSNGEERKPHPNPQPNAFGLATQKFYDSFILRNEFP